ncbi:hypothetical protein [Amycolatopsis thermoflava]|uniref:hypothetical protein n=1 Tax=Amycolatopsis thermoflava TaxID=84480 RepID=UPI0004089D9D|nr:hypothetical protein [Amycolatopsis thermoflava]
MEWLPTAGPYGALGAIIIYLVRLLIVTDRRHTTEINDSARRHAAEMTRISEAHAAEMKRINEAHAAEMKRINEAHDEEILELRDDIARLREDIAQLQNALDTETQTRRAAEELAHQLRTGVGNAGNREGSPPHRHRARDRRDPDRPVRGVADVGGGADSDGLGGTGGDSVPPGRVRRAEEGA